MMGRPQPLFSRLAQVFLVTATLGASLSSHRAQAAPATAYAQDGWAPGGTPEGLAGMHRLLYGHTAAPEGLTFALGADVAYAQGVLFADLEDQLWVSRQSLAVVWTLGRMLEIGVGATSGFALDSVFADNVASSILPVVRLKYSAGLWRQWAGGLSASWQAPPLSGSSGALAPADATYTLQALGSRKLVRAWELVVNVGFIYDRATHTTAGTTNPLQLFVDERNASSRVSLATGVTSPLYPIWRQLMLQPYAEITSEWSLRHSRLADNPVRLSIGSKVFFNASRAVEADVGIDVRLLGAPRYGSPYAGLTPWSIFAALSYHSKLAALDLGRHEVVYVPTRVYEKPGPTVVLSGYVHDANALVLGGARIAVGNDANTLLGVDPNTGKYRTEALLLTWEPRHASVATKPGDTPRQVQAPRPLDITCTADGYVTQHQVIQVPPQGGVVRVDFHLQRKPASAHLRLRAFDAVSGKPVAGAQALVTGSYADETNLDAVYGELRTSMRPGHYTLIITAPGYELKRSEINLLDDTELILNFGLAPKPSEALPASP